jgi:hypothetical protein
MLAPPNKLAAGLEAIYWATLEARTRAWSGERDGLPAEVSGEIAELMDAVHNIPHLLQRWETCDEALLREMLRACDARCRTGLLARYESYA